MKERTLIIIKLVLTHFLLSLGLVFIAIVFNQESFLLITIAQSIILLIFFAGYWEFFANKFKWIYCVSIELLLLFALTTRIISGISKNPTFFLLSLLVVIQVYLIVQLCRIGIVIFKKDDEKMEIEFPFKKGLFLITDGGNSKISRMMNYHFHSSVHKKKNTNRSMLYATDIVKLSNKKTEFIPTKNEGYVIFNENIYSPMEGVIFKIINDIEDNKPFSGNYPYNTGNTVVVKKDNYYFLLGHLKRGSIIVKEGDSVIRGELIGKVGNSGMSERPHLHMQLIKCDSEDYWKGLGICIQYNNRNLYKNRLINK